MKRIAVSALLLVLPACSSAPGDGSEVQSLVAQNDLVRIEVSSADQVDLSQCSAGSPGPELVRCGDSNASGNAITVCGALVANDAVTARSGAIVVGGDSRIDGSVSVRQGSFTSFGGIEGNGREDIDGDLTTSSNWVVGAPARVGGEAFVGGRLVANRPVRIGGTLHVAGAVSGDVRAANTASDAPRGTGFLSCAGAPDAQVVADGAERLALTDEDQVLSAVSRRTRVTLGCGRYRFSSLGVTAELSIHVEGNVVMLVEGDATIEAPVHVDVAPGASLDVIVRGDLDLEDALSVEGPPTWLEVGGRIHVAGPLNFGGWLFAPHGEISVDAPFHVNGALYAGALTAESSTVVDALTR